MRELVNAVLAQPASFAALIGGLGIGAAGVFFLLLEMFAQNAQRSPEKRP